MNGFGESVAATGLVTMPTVPSAPLGVHALGGHHAVIVRWGVPRSDGGDPVTGYRIEYATCSPTATGCGFTTVHVGSTVRSLRLNHLRARTTYRVCVLARSDVGSSHPSRVVSATTAKK
jgi:hypothetical protein